VVLQCLVIDSSSLIILYFNFFHLSLTHILFVLSFCFCFSFPLDSLHCTLIMFIDDVFLCCYFFVYRKIHLFYCFLFLWLLFANFNQASFNDLSLNLELSSFSRFLFFDFCLERTSSKVFLVTSILALES